eukprot:scaffold92088_cov63-Phaeocystis_antarctica.AAC.2
MAGRVGGCRSTHHFPSPAMPHCVATSSAGLHLYRPRPATRDGARPARQGLWAATPASSRCRGWVTIVWSGTA